MDVRTTKRFVDREALAANPANPDAADTPAGTILSVSAGRALHLLETGFGQPIGVDRATLERLALAESEAALLASVVPLAPIAVPPADPAPVADGTSAPVASSSEHAPADPSDGGPVDLTK
ncbi:hypothetical protein ASG37_04930 [Sphingomonas sp. Leaf407]|uniref:hypothetical protein n=1 Tax=unclassified Sphingomonas TaxID=196159 RepID=UPI0006F35B74|nr:MULTISPECIES: hypothetical protein [unclassified Sphingomonas]KQN37008.1 hypothetical protein ASE97_10845 [Sphingomonas sp. Leaf42]KQT30435.1 hypothetical protein ASG37_04930 [Sphingomonas sp. Leaf407]